MIPKHNAQRAIYAHYIIIDEKTSVETRNKPPLPAWFKYSLRDWVFYLTSGVFERAGKYLEAQNRATKSN